MRPLAVCTALLCLGTTTALVSLQESPAARRELVSVMHRQSAVSEDERVTFDIAFLDPRQVRTYRGDDGDSLRRYPVFAAGDPVRLQVRIKNETSEPLSLLEPLFVSDEEPSASIYWYPGSDDDPHIPAGNRPHPLENQFTRWPFLTEFGRSESLRRRDRPQRTIVPPGTTIVRDVCLSNVYDLSSPWRYYQIFNPAIQLERTTGEAITLGDVIEFQVTGPDTPDEDTPDASIVRE